MEQKQLSDLTDDELLAEAKRHQSAKTTNAILIGFLIGIILYSVMENTFGLVGLIILYFIHKLVNAGKYDEEALNTMLQERNLK